MHDPDYELARRCQEGDVAAYADLVHRHRRMVYRVARGVLGSVDEAEDVVQEAFLRAYRHIGAFGHRQVFGGWLRRIAVNCAIDRLRGLERERRRHAEVAANPGPTSDPAQEVVRGELGHWVRRAIGELPVKQRVAVSLFYLDDMSVNETAHDMGCSTSAVKTHLYRARRALARRMAEHFEED